MSSPGPARAQKTPEMDVSGRDKQNLKTGAPNFEKEKLRALSNFQKVFFFRELKFSRGFRTGHDQNQ